MARHPYNIIILGPQGSGKGTQADVLARKFNLEHIETGKIFRKIARQKNNLGRTINRLINIRGCLVPTPQVVRVLEKVLIKVNPSQGLIFDGYPRNLIQAKALGKQFRLLGRRLTHVFYLPISRQSTINRLVLRRTCSQCGRTFILGKNISSQAWRCPKCGGRIYQREDDKPKAIARRLEQYLKQTKPLIVYYRKLGLVKTINGEPPIRVVTKQILKHFS